MWSPELDGICNRYHRTHLFYSLLGSWSYKLLSLSSVLRIDLLRLHSRNLQALRLGEVSYKGIGRNNAKPSYSVGTDTDVLGVPAISSKIVNN